VELQEVMLVAATPLKVTVLLPCVVPKFAPLIVTAVPGGAVLGVTLETTGGTRTVKSTPPLGAPPTVTTTGPVVAVFGTTAVMLPEAQALTEAATPLKVTVLLPCVLPKFDPAIVTDIPTGPLFGDRLLITGGAVLVTT
jgi:hypothetical protein